MSISGLGSVMASVGSGYDFTKMTNKQLFDAAQTLGSEGKISERDAAQLSETAQGVDSVPISGPSPSVQSILADPSTHNFVQHVQGILDDMNKWGGVGAAMYQSLLKDFSANQSTALNADQTLSISA